MSKKSSATMSALAEPPEREGKGEKISVHTPKNDGSSRTRWVEERHAGKGARESSNMKEVQLEVRAGNLLVWKKVVQPLCHLASVSQPLVQPTVLCTCTSCALRRVAVVSASNMFLHSFGTKSNMFALLDKIVSRRNRKSKSISPMNASRLGRLPVCLAF